MSIDIITSNGKKQGKSNYKKTKLGWIPEEWKIEKLSKLTEKIGSGITPKGGSEVYTTNGHPFIRSQNVGWGKLLLEDMAYIPEDIHESMSSTELKQGDVLLNITGASIGRSALVTEKIKEGNVNQHVCIIRPKDSVVDERFLNSFLISWNGQKQIESFQAGGNRQGLNFQQIGMFKIPLPPLPEQKKIAEILSTWDHAIETLEQLIAKKEELKRGLMQELLSGKTRFPGFEGEWREVRLGDICEFNYGKSWKDIEDESGDFPVYGTSGEIGRASKAIYDKPSVIVGRKGTIDQPFYLDHPFWAVDTVFYTILKSDSINLKWLYYKFLTIKWLKYNEASGVPSLSVSTIKGIKVLVPDLKEQIQIVKTLDSVELELMQLETLIDSIYNQKKGLMQQLLTGKTRVML